MGKANIICCEHVVQRMGQGIEDVEEGEPGLLCNTFLVGTLPRRSSRGQPARSTRKRHRKPGNPFGIMLGRVAGKPPA